LCGVTRAADAAAIIVHLVIRFGFQTESHLSKIPLLVTLGLGGTPLVYELLRKTLRREFGSDLLAGISIVTSVLLGEYLAGSIVVLMLSGGETLENYALQSASSVLAALAKRMPSIAHRKRDSQVLDMSLEDVVVGDTLVIYPHDIRPSRRVPQSPRHRPDKYHEDKSRAYRPRRHPPATYPRLENPVYGGL